MRSTSDGQLSGWTEKKLQNASQRQTCTKKRSWSVFGGLLLLWSTTALWIPAKPLHLRNMPSKWWNAPKKYNACSWHWWTERTQFFSMTMSDCTSHNQCFKSWTNWTTEFFLICHIHLASCQPTPTYFFKHSYKFVHGKCFQKEQEAAKSFQEFF